MAFELTRRRLLASVGTVGAAAGTATLLTGSSRAYTHFTYAGQREPARADREHHDLRVAWWTSRNGRTVETQGDDSAGANATLDAETAPAYVPDAPGPVLTATNVLPGDEGRLGIGIQASLDDDSSVAVWYRTRLVAASDNGVNEPERAAGDEPGNGSELPDRATLTVWEDTGAIGACDGRLTLGTESPVEDGDGTLRAVATGLSDGQRFDGCLTDGDTRCLGVKWALPARGSDINVVQGDSATFSIEFRTTPCRDGSAENPFAGGEADG